jgi:excisionase family DNA binding protein
MLEHLPDILTLKECQETLFIGKNLMLELVQSGTLPAFRVGKKWRITKDNLKKYINTISGYGL